VDFPAFVASRLAYRRLGGRLGWLLVPFALALVLRLPLIYALAARMGRASGLDTGARVLVALGAVIVTDAAVVTVAVAAAARRAWAATSALVVGGRGLAQNDAARVRARQLVAEGYAGLVTGHTHHPELAVLDGGFYANTGSGSVVVERAGARLGLPGVFAAHIQLSWIELEAAASLHVRLLHGRRDLPGTTLLERLVAGRAVVTRGRPAVVASYPPGPSWPPTADPALGVRRIRRVAAAAIAAAGVLNIVSAFTPPLGDRLRALLDLVPLSVPQAATGAEVIGGLGLLLVARGIRRGQRRAWAVSIVLLGLAAVLHVAKGVDVEEAAAVVALAVYLLRHRSAFSGGVRPASARQGAVGAVLAGLAATALGTVVVEIGSGAERPSLGRAVLGVAQRIVLVGGTSLPARPLNEFLTPALGAVGVSLALFAGWVALRPVLAAHHRPGRDLDQARDIVRRHGAGTLAYFALRDDKRHFFAGESVVAYGVFAGVCLVSPDPVGPVAEREQVWAAFRSFADRHSWAVAVMGAAEDWLPTYRRAGMRDLYVGDEAVVDCRRFSLDGNRNKGLRQAVNRVAKYGYRVEFHDPATISPELRDQLHQVMTKSRKGDVERGFSMTLGRAFDAADEGLLLAVCVGPHGEPVAFCQYVPAPGIGGYSLDLMRRDAGEHPNGVTDFVVVETIRHLRDAGGRGLALNFATMRAVLAGEAGDGVAQRLQRSLLVGLSDSMQIESLWRFTAKYHPQWRPCYAVYDAPEHLVAAALAVARAESFWELPVIGRFLTPGSRSRQQTEAAVGAGVRR